MFGRKEKLLREQLADAEMIIAGYDCMLNMAHLSENRSLACNYARNEIKEYKERWNKNDRT